MLVTFGFGNAVALGAFGLEDLLASLSVAFRSLSERSHVRAIALTTASAAMAGRGVVLQEKDQSRSVMAGDRSIDRAGKARHGAFRVAAVAALQGYIHTVVVNNVDTRAAMHARAGKEIVHTSLPCIRHCCVLLVSACGDACLRQLIARP